MVLQRSLLAETELGGQPHYYYFFILHVRPSCSSIATSSSIDVGNDESAGAGTDAATVARGHAISVSKLAVSCA